MRGRLIFLVLLALLPAFAVVLYTGIEQRGNMATIAKTGAMRLAHIAAAEHNQTIENTRILLEGIAQSPPMQQTNPIACGQMLSDLLKTYPQYTAMGVATPTGEVFCKSSSAELPVNFADREWFRQLANTGEFVVSDALIGRLSGEPVIVLAAPVLDENQGIKSVIAVGLSLDWVSQLAGRSDLPTGTVLLIVNDRGTILATNLDPQDWIGKTLPEAPVIQAALTESEGTIETEGTDGVRRLYAFASISSSTAQTTYTIVGVPSAVAYAGPNRILVRNLALLAIVVLLAILSAERIGNLFLLRRFRLLVDTSQKLGSGDLSARTGLSHERGEFGELARAFEDMAAKLQQDNSEQKRAEAALAASEQRYRWLFGSMGEGYAYCQMIYEQAQPCDWIYLAVNDAFLALSGMKDAVGKRVSEIIPGLRESDPALFEIYGRVALTGRPEKFEIFVEALQIWFSVSVYCPEVGYFTALFDVITERKRAEEALRTSEEYARSIVESSLDMIISTDSQRRIVEFNRAAQEAFGYSREDVVGKHIDILYDNPDEGTEKRRNVLENGKIVGEIVNRRKNGERFISFLSATILRNSRGELIGTVGVSRDITEQKQAAEMLHLRAKELSVLHAVSAACVEITDENTLIERATQVIGEKLFANNFGLLLSDETNNFLRVHPSYRIPEEVKKLAIPLGKGVIGWVAANGRPLRIDDVAETPEYEEVDPAIKSELCVPLRVGERVIGVINAEGAHRYAFTEADERILLTIAGQLAMAIDRLRTETELNQLASMDELTGLFNRRSFFAMAEHELKRNHQMKKPTCAIMLDIDHFKLVNDTYGHPLGDKVLRELADRCRKDLREADLIGRYGGEEFVILLPATDIFGAQLVAERLREDVERCSLENNSGCPPVTISLGVAQATGDKPDLSRLLNNADIALYAAKHSGRNRVSTADYTAL